MTTLLRLLQTQAETRPERCAIKHRQLPTHYGELWLGIQRIANGLIEGGFKPGGRVAVLLENSPAYAAIYYGIWAAGGIAVGMNTAARPMDIAGACRHCDSRWLFVAENHPGLETLKQELSNQTQIIVISAPLGLDQLPWPGESISKKASQRSPATDAGQAASIIYTSGTTGRPKGVTLSHHNIYSNIQSINAYLQLGPQDLTSVVLPFFYSYGASILHTHLAAGAGLLLENSLVYPHQVIERMAAEKVSGFSGVPATFYLLEKRVQLEDHDLSALRYLTQAGGHMAADAINRWRLRLPHARFFVMYGQTEATARLTYLAQGSASEKSGSVGQAVNGVQLSISDAGEVCARGDNVMLGYWQDEERTREVLRDGWLHTGDLGYLDSEGFLYLKGRAVEQIKSGGHRIDPAEIEQALELQGDIAEAAVRGVQDDVLGEIIEAYVVIKQGCKPDVLSLKRHCAQYLASYKIPKIFQFVSQLPRTASGKIQRHQLGNVEMAPSTGIEPVTDP